MLRNIKGKLFTILISLILIIQFIPVSGAVYAQGNQNSGNDISNKATIGNITATGITENGEQKIKLLDQNAKPEDFDYTLEIYSTLTFHIPLEIDKESPIEVGDQVLIPIERIKGGGTFVVSKGVKVEIDDGSLEALLRVDMSSIELTFTKVNGSKCDAQVELDIRLKYVSGKNFSVDTAKQKQEILEKYPTSIVAVGFGGKQVSARAYSNCNIVKRFITWKSTPELITEPVAPTLMPSFYGVANNERTVDWSIGSWGKGSNEFRICIDNGTEEGVEEDVTIRGFNELAFMMGEKIVFGNLPKGENSYGEMTFPANIYKNAEITAIKSSATCLQDEKENTARVLLKSDGYGYVPESCADRNLNNIGLYLAKNQRNQEKNQTYAEFKKSLGVGQYGFYTESNTGNIKYVFNYGDLGADDPSKKLTWGQLCEIFGKKEIINTCFIRCTLNRTYYNPSNSEESIEPIYNKIKDWPAIQFSPVIRTTLVKPVLVNDQKITQKARVFGEVMSATVTVPVNSGTIKSNPDGMIITKVDADTGFGIGGVGFQLQVKDGEEWKVADIQNVKATQGTKDEENKLFFTHSTGILEIRGLANGSTYRLKEVKPAKGYSNLDPSTNKPVVSNEAKISYETVQDNKAGFIQKGIINQKLKYQVQYEIIKNPSGDEIPEDSPKAPEDDRSYYYNEQVYILSKPSFDGYKFSGWHTNQDSLFKVNKTDGEFNMPDSDVKLVGYWIQDEIPIEYKSEDLSMGDVTNKSETVQPTEDLTGTKAIPKEGYSFIGWYDASDDNKTIISTDPEFKPEKNENNEHLPKTYVAHFRKNVNDEIQITKTVIGDAFDKGSKKETFCFEIISEKKDTPMPKINRVTISTDELLQEESTTITKSFGSVEYVKPGIYEYKVSEIKGHSREYEYDGTVYHIVIQVKENDGKLEIKKTVQNQNKQTTKDSNCVFVNKYKPTGKTIQDSKIEKDKNIDNDKPNRTYKYKHSDVLIDAFETSGNKQNISKVEPESAQEVTKTIPNTKDTLRVGMFATMFTVSCAMFVTLLRLKHRYS